MVADEDREELRRRRRRLYITVGDERIQPAQHFESTPNSRLRVQDASGDNVGGGCSGYARSGLFWCWTKAPRRSRGRIFGRPKHRTLPSRKEVRGQILYDSEASAFYFRGRHMPSPKAPCVRLPRRSLEIPSFGVLIRCVESSAPTTMIG